METLDTITDNLTGQNPSGNANYPLKYLTASTITGDKVYNDADEHLGTIKEIMLDITTGKIEYCIIEFGGFLGIGEKFFAIPWRLLKVDGDKKAIRFSESKEKLQQAPGFDKEHWPETNFHSNYVTQSWSFWGE